ncbi:MAG: glycosyltransferase [Anaerolineae bacterium]|nr:glycosyltransferase [Anaerolineae bacterium]
MKIILLSTWFPYPPSQGSKTRAYHLIRALAQAHEVTLISFADTEIQPEWVAHMKQICARVHIVQREPFHQGRLRTGLGWLSLKPSAVVGTYSTEMSACVKQAATEWQPDCVVALTFSTAPYALELKTLLPNLRLVMDVDNLLTRMLREAYNTANGTAQRARRWVAWWKIRRYEVSLYRQFDLSLVITEQDRHQLIDIADNISLGHARGPSPQIAVVPNGVDIASNAQVVGTPQPSTCVFSGALTYYANYDAMAFFLRDVFPEIYAAIPEARLSITGSTRNVAVDRLPAHPNVVLTGFLDDVRGLVANSWVSVAPLRIGGGTRLKFWRRCRWARPSSAPTKGQRG